MVMLILQIARWLLIMIEVCLLVSVLYLDILALAALVAARRKSPAPMLADDALPDFAILIPAHNEELMLGTLLASLAELDYPRTHYSVYVVADNCSDGTAALARAHEGVHVYERFDEARRGKGYALNWLLARLDEERRVYDACVVLDADSRPEPAFLRPLAYEVVRGAQALQACNTVLNVAESPSTALRWIALTLMNHVRPLGRNALGASATLTGNGMCLSRALLQRFPWRAFSVGEDYQYYLNLIEHGVRVRYVPQAVVRSHMPPKFAQMRTQDIRWEAGEPGRPTWRVAGALLRAALRSRDLARFEALLELLAPPLSLLVCGVFLLLVGALALWALPGLLLALLLVCGLICYLGSAFYLLRPPWATYRALLFAPGFVLWKVWVYLVLKRSKRRAREWVRTSRSVSLE